MSFSMRFYPFTIFFCLILISRISADQFHLQKIYQDTSITLSQSKVFAINSKYLVIQQGNLSNLTIDIYDINNQFKYVRTIRGFSTISPIYTKNSIILTTSNRLLVHPVSARVSKVQVNITGIPIVQYWNDQSTYSSKILYSKHSLNNVNSLTLQSMNLSSLQVSQNQLKTISILHQHTTLASLQFGDIAVLDQNSLYVINEKNPSVILGNIQFSSINLIKNKQFQYLSTDVYSRNLIVVGKNTNDPNQQHIFKYDPNNKSIAYFTRIFNPTSEIYIIENQKGVSLNQQYKYNWNPLTSSKKILKISYQGEHNKDLDHDDIVIAVSSNQKHIAVYKKTQNAITIKHLNIQSLQIEIKARIEISESISDDQPFNFQGNFTINDQQLIFITQGQKGKILCLLSLFAYNYSCSQPIKECGLGQVTQIPDINSSIILSCYDNSTHKQTIYKYHLDLTSQSNFSINTNFQQHLLYSRKWFNSTTYVLTSPSTISIYKSNQTINYQFQISSIHVCNQYLIIQNSTGIHAYNLLLDKWNNIQLTFIGKTVNINVADNLLFLSYYPFQTKNPFEQFSITVLYDLSITNLSQWLKGYYIFAQFGFIMDTMGVKNMMNSIILPKSHLLYLYRSEERSSVNSSVIYNFETPYINSIEITYPSSSPTLQLSHCFVPPSNYEKWACEYILNNTEKRVQYDLSTKYYQFSENYSSLKNIQLFSTNRRWIAASYNTLLSQNQDKMYSYYIIQLIKPLQNYPRSLYFRQKAQQKIKAIDWTMTDQVIVTFEKSLLIMDIDIQGKKPGDHIHKLISGVNNNIDIKINILSSQLLYDEIVVAFIYGNNTYIAIYKDTNNPILTITDLTNKKSIFRSNLTLIFINSVEEIRIIQISPRKTILGYITKSKVCVFWNISGLNDKPIINATCDIQNIQFCSQQQIYQPNKGCNSVFNSVQKQSSTLSQNIYAISPDGKYLARVTYNDSVPIIKINTNLDDTELKSFIYEKNQTILSIKFNGDNNLSILTDNKTIYILSPTPCPDGYDNINSVCICQGNTYEENYLSGCKSNSHVLAIVFSILGSIAGVGVIAIIVYKVKKYRRTRRNGINPQDIQPLNPKSSVRTQ